MRLKRAYSAVIHRAYTLTPTAIYGALPTVYGQRVYDIGKHTPANLNQQPCANRRATLP